MAEDRAEKFSAEDLNLLKDLDAGEDVTEKAPTEKAPEGAPEPKTEEKIEDKGSGDTSGKTEEKKSEAKGGTLFDDLDDDDSGTDDDEQDSKSEAKSDDTEDKSEDKKEEKKEGVDDWRTELANLALRGQENKLTAAKLEKRKEALMRDLGRYKSQQDYMLAGMAAREKLRTGEYKRAELPEDATEEEVANWRKENGVPEKAESYEIPKVAGYQWSGVDDPYIASFKEVAFKGNYTQTQLNAAADWYARTMAEQQDKYLETITGQDRADAEELDDTLRNELGRADYKPSRELVRRFLKDDETGFGAIKDSILSARYTDAEGKSRRLINNIDFTRKLIDLAHETYGDAAMISGDARSNMNNRKKEIEALMESDITEYHRKGWDKEYVEILERESKSGRRR